MRSLALTSRGFNQAYHGACESLSYALKRQHGLPLIGDDLLVLRSAQLHAKSDITAKKRRSQVIALLDRYRCDLGLHGIGTTQYDVCHSFASLPLTFREATQLVDLFTRLHGFVQDMAHELERKASSVGSRNSLDEGAQLGTLTPLEQQRFLRACCRYQTYCHLFGARTPIQLDISYDHWPLSQHFDPETIYSLYFSIFPPWEVEEIACIYDYLVQLYIACLSTLRRTIARWTALASNRGLGVRRRTRSA